MRLADRIVDILYCLQTEGGGLGVTEVATRLGLPKSTAHRLLQALETRWLVSQDAQSQRYILGLGLVAMASSVLQEKNLLLAPCQGLMEKLRDLSGETVCLHVPSGMERVCIRQVEGRHSVRYTMQVGKPMPLYAGASGKLLLAFMPPRIVERVIRTTGLVPITPKTVTDPERLRAELEEIRSAGYAVSFEETGSQVAAIAAPVQDRRGQVIACVTLYGPSMRLDPSRVAEMLPALLETAADMSRVIAPVVPEMLGIGSNP